MRTIKIDTECNAWDLYPDEWKGYVYGPQEEFDDVFVIVAPRHYYSITNADWYEKALDYIDENDLLETEDEIMKTLEKLYPNDRFDKFDITGYTQGEYATVIYKANKLDISCDLNEFVECFGDYYFGHVTEFIDTQENVHEYVADSEFWKHENKDLKSFVCDILCIDKDEDIQLLKSNGYTQVKNWTVV
jgi:hypothetical protein